MSIEFVLAAGQTVLSLIAIIFHIAGLLALRQTSSTQVNQKVYLIHLSVMEIVFLTSHNIPLYMKLTNVNQEVVYCTGLAVITAVAIPWYNLLLALTIDRFLQVYLNIKYQLYVTDKVIKIIIFSCWFIGIALFGILFLLRILYNYNTERLVHGVLYKIFLNIYHSLVIIIFLLTYGYIYYQLRKVKESKDGMAASSDRNRKANFIPFWIVISFILFILVPESIHICVSLNKQPDTDTAVHDQIEMFIFAMVLFDVGCLVDALLYIFLNEFVRERFLRCMRQMICRHENCI